MSKEEQRKKNREDFSEVMPFLDDCRKYFGDGIKIIYMEQDGKSVGKKPEEIEGQQAP